MLLVVRLDPDTLGRLVYERLAFDLEDLEFDSDRHVFSLPLEDKAQLEDEVVGDSWQLGVGSAQSVSVDDQAGIGVYDIFPIEVTSSAVVIRSNFPLSITVFVGEGAWLVIGRRDIAMDVAAASAARLHQSDRAPGESGTPLILGDLAALESLLAGQWLTLAETGIRTEAQFLSGDIKTDLGGVTWGRIEGRSLAHIGWSGGARDPVTARVREVRWDASRTTLILDLGQGALRLGIAPDSRISVLSHRA